MNTEITTTSTGYKLKIGTSDFSKLVTESDLFVDKTLLIHDIIDDANEVLLITRPRRWGKTLNMSMLQYFFAPNIKSDGSSDQDLHEQKMQILSKLQIFSHTEVMEKYFGKYPVISVSFNNIDTGSYNIIKEFVADTIYDLYKAHEYLRYSDKLSESDKFDLEKYLTTSLTDPMITKGIKRLSQMLYKHFEKQVIIVIDEYDKPLNDLYANKLSKASTDESNDEYLKSVLNLFKVIFTATFKDNSYLKKGIVTGVLRIAKASLFSGLNNFGEDTILDKELAKYFGFTEDEVNVLLCQSGMAQNAELVTEIKNWYNGYHMGDYTIYNPWSIMNMLKKHGSLEAYWVGTADPGLLQRALVLDKFQEEIQTLIEGDTISMTADPKMVFSEIQTSSNALYNLLLFSGYLTADKVSQNVSGITYKCNVRIPNKEVRGIFIESVQQWVIDKLKILPKAYEAFVAYLFAGDVDQFTIKLKDYLENSSSYFDSGDKKAELLYNGFMWGLFASGVSEDYFVEKERETGGGRADLLIIPKSTADYDIAFILEYKIASKSEDLIATAGIALEQIKNKNYISKIKSYENVSKVISVGLAFCGKEVEVMHLETDLNLNKGGRSSS